MHVEESGFREAAAVPVCITLQIMPAFDGSIVGGMPPGGSVVGGWIGPY
jgi:hypothetical protein